MTVCNQNRIHCTKLDEVVANCSTEDGGTDEGAARNCELLKTINAYACSRMEPDVENDVDTNEVPSSLDIEYKFLYLYMDIDETTRLSVGHQRDDMIKFCSFKGKLCPQGWVGLNTRCPKKRVK